MRWKMITEQVIFIGLILLWAYLVIRAVNGDCL
jgi:hypothetical protein